MRTGITRGIALAPLLMFVSALWAADGVTEINQASVEAAGGFPYTITEPGSYLLTGNLTVPDENTSAIEVRADDVTLDLNGFAIQCADSDGVNCEPSPGSGEGVTVFFVIGENFDTGSNTVVRNGTVRGMGFAGVKIDFGLVEGIQALENGGPGIVMGEGVIADCVARENAGTGIELEKGVAAANIAVLNGGDGIKVRNGVARNNTSAGNDGDGIVSEGSALILGNNVTNNSGAGLNLVSESGGVSGYTGNVINDTVTGGQAIGCNLIDGSQICPNLPINTR